MRRLATAPWWLPVVLVLLVLSVGVWSTMTRLGPTIAFDSGAFLEYARHLDETGRLPTEAENYEYSLPPGLPLLGVYAERLVELVPFTPPRPLESLPSWLRRALWLVLAAGSAAALGVCRGRRQRLAAAAGAAVAALWAGAYVLAFAEEQAWVVKPLVGFASSLLLVALVALLAREIWPERRFAPGLAAAAFCLLPVVPRMAILFHPDPLFAALSTAALIVVLRASRRGWAVGYAVAAGAALGLSALVRQAAPILVIGTVAGAVLLGRRRALPFLAVLAVSLVVVAGPWWGYQASRFGNPIESNLDRPGYMLDRQPLSFFVSLPPPDLVTRPYRESFKNELLPKLHAELWSDWFGTFTDSWRTSTRADRFVASTQSVLGFGGDALVLGGLVAFGLPALRRALSRLPDRVDGAFAALTAFWLLAFVAYLVTLVRFPQVDGDPIKSHYLLFLAPAAAVFGLRAGMWLWERGTPTRVALAVWLALYALSYGALFLTSP